MRWELVCRWYPAVRCVAPSCRRMTAHPPGHRQPVLVRIGSDDTAPSVQRMGVRSASWVMCVKSSVIVGARSSVRRSPCHNPPPPLPCNDAQQGQRREPCALLFRGLRNPKQDSPPRLSFVVWKLVSRLPLGSDRQPASVAARDYLVGIAWPLLLRGPRIRIGEGKEKPRSLADLRGILGEVSFVAAAGITAKQLPDRLTRRSSRIVASLATSFSWIFSAPRAILDSQLRRRRGSQPAFCAGCCSSDLAVWRAETRSAEKGRSPSTASSDMDKPE